MSQLKITLKRSPIGYEKSQGLTANALGHHRDLWLAVGVAAFLTKPIDPQLLVATIMTATNRKVESRSEDAVA